jgi:hypothetical protein
MPLWGHRISTVAACSPHRNASPSSSSSSCLSSCQAAVELRFRRAEITSSTRRSPAAQPLLSNQAPAALWSSNRRPTASHLAAADPPSSSQVQSPHCPPIEHSYSHPTVLLPSATVVAQAPHANLWLAGADGSRALYLCGYGCSQPRSDFGNSDGVPVGWVNSACRSPF